MSARKEEFLQTGAKLAAQVGIANVTRRAIAQAHNVTDPLVGKNVGNKAELQAGIKKTMKKLGLREPDSAVAAAKGKALRARKDASPAVKQRLTAAKKRAEPKAKKVVAKKSAGSKVGPKSSKTSRDKKSANGLIVKPKLPAAPKNKAVKKAPSNKRFAPKAPPAPALPPQA